MGDEALHACPTDVVAVPLERIWPLVSDPGQLGWVARLVDGPARTVRAGDRLVFEPKRGLRVSWDVLAVEPPHDVTLDVRLPFGMSNRMTIHVSRIDDERCRVTFN